MDKKKKDILINLGLVLLFLAVCIFSEFLIPSSHKKDWDFRTGRIFGRLFSAALLSSLFLLIRDLRKFRIFLYISLGFATASIIGNLFVRSYTYWGKIDVSFPGIYVELEENRNSELGEFDIFSKVLEVNDISLVLHEITFFKKHTKIYLEDLVEMEKRKTLSDPGTELVSQIEKNDIFGPESIELVLKLEPDRYVKSRYYIQSEKIYQVSVYAPLSELEGKISRQFFDSIHIKRKFFIF
ncbi:hypothetical protein [Leptospira sarikeiensis]|uniref:Uncharacterized protein n=1 Tax=Leptospira sarikeiensis TaxID=2484943 RepID=A0A4R9K717_9LEPT|nr:hypothetical protein [Leptospira sarikeiensis]TGL61412.1 hypothetical protein EHQ64_10515 [Leptospira sarikeiensis]